MRDPTCEKPEPIVEPRRDVLRRHRAHARRRELDRERQPVQAPADLRDGGGIVRGEIEVGTHRARPLDEQPHRFHPRHLFDPSIVGFGNAERSQTPANLTGDIERLATRREHLHIRAGREEPVDDLRARVDQVLAVVEHDEEPPPQQVVGERLADVPAGLLAHPENVGHRFRDELRIRQRSEVDKPSAVGKVAEKLGPHLQREPRLAHAAGSRERHEPGLGQRIADAGDVVVPPDECRCLDLEVVRHDGESARRWKLRRKVRMGELEQPDRVREILQAVRAEIDEADVVPVGARSLGDEHLPTVGRRGDARRLVHRKTDVVVAVHSCLAAMDAHPHPDRCIKRPLMPGERPLPGDGCRDSLPRVVEGDEERVALRRDLVSVVRGPRLAQQPVVLVEDAVVVVAEVLQEPRRRLDIGEQEGDGAAGRRSVGHRDPPRNPARPRRGKAATPCPTCGGIDA